MTLVVVATIERRSYSATSLHDWVIDPGFYSIILAASATDPRSTVDVTI